MTDLRLSQKRTSVGDEWCICLIHFVGKRVRDHSLVVGGLAVDNDGIVPATQSNFSTQALTIADTLSPCKSAAQYYPVIEATIGDVQDAFIKGSLSCTQLVQTYIEVNPADVPCVWQVCKLNHAICWCQQPFLLPCVLSL